MTAVVAHVRRTRRPCALSSPSRLEFAQDLHPQGLRRRGLLHTARSRDGAGVMIRFSRWASFGDGPVGLYPEERRGPGELLQSTRDHARTAPELCQDGVGDRERPRPSSRRRTPPAAGMAISV